MLNSYFSFDTYTKSSVLKVLKDAENENEGPVFFIDVIKAWSKSKLPTAENLMILRSLYDFYRDDQI